MRNFIRGAFWFCFLVLFVLATVAYFTSQGKCYECHGPAAGIFLDTNNQVHVLCRKHAIIYLQTEANQPLQLK